MGRRFLSQAIVEEGLGSNVSGLNYVLFQDECCCRHQILVCWTPGWLLTVWFEKHTARRHTRKGILLTIVYASRGQAGADAATQCSWCRSLRHVWYLVLLPQLPIFSAIWLIRCNGSEEKSKKNGGYVPWTIFKCGLCIIVTWMVHTVVDHIKALHIQINKLILNKMEALKYNYKIHKATWP